MNMSDEKAADKLVKTTIDGREVEVARDRWALEVARDLGVFIPSLCHHPALEPYGACRLCVVEVTKGRRSWLTTACDLPIREGLSIRTDTPEVLKARRMAMELLWAQAPDSQRIRDLARRMGVEKPRFASRDPENKCILCGLCVRVCQDLIGASAIGFSSRGAVRVVGTPFDRSSTTCNACGACVAVCPTGHILSVDDGLVRKMITWKTDVPLARCESCGEPFASEKMMELVRAKLPTHVKLEKICEKCRRLQTARRLSKASARGKQLTRPVYSGKKRSL